MENYKMLLISNMFPSKKYPEYGTFVMNFYEQMKKKDYLIEKVVVNKSNHKAIKAIKYLSFYFKIYFKILLNKYDIIYVHYVSHSSLPLLFLPKKFKIIVNIHGSDIKPKGPMKEMLEIINKRIIKKSDLIVVPTEYYKEIVVYKYEQLSSKVFVSPSGGVDSSIFNTRDIISENEEIFKIGFASRLVKEKGWKTLLEAIKIIKEEKIQVQIVGEGKDLKKLTEYISKNNLETIITLEGAKSQKELSKFYQNIDIFIFPSHAESLGLVGIEAMASGCIVIASDHPGILSYLKDNENGFCFSTKSSQSLANTILEVMELNKSKKEEVIQNAIITAKSYDSNVIATRLDLKIRECMCN